MAVIAFAEDREDLAKPLAHTHAIPRDNDDIALVTGADVDGRLCHAVSPFEVQLSVAPARAGTIGVYTDPARMFDHSSVGIGPDPLFRDRFDAGRILAQALADEREIDAVVIGLARGGIQVAAEVARVLGLPLDAVAVRKIRHPSQPEYALGAVTPADGIYLRASNGLTDRQLAAAVTAAQDEAEELERRLHADRLPLELAGKQAIIVDDGLATAATMIAAIRWARSRGAIGVIAAAPVGSAHGAALVRKEADRVVCPYEFVHFGGVGAWYDDFGQVDDGEAVRLLDQEGSKR